MSIDSIRTKLISSAKKSLQAQVAAKARGLVSNALSKATNGLLGGGERQVVDSVYNHLIDLDNKSKSLNPSSVLSELLGKLPAEVSGSISKKLNTPYDIASTAATAVGAHVLTSPDIGKQLVSVWSSKLTSHQTSVHDQSDTMTDALDKFTSSLKSVRKLAPDQVGTFTAVTEMEASLLAEARNVTHLSSNLSALCTSSMGPSTRAIVLASQALQVLKNEFNGMGIHLDGINETVDGATNTVASIRTVSTSNLSAAVSSVISDENLSNISTITGLLNRSIGYGTASGKTLEQAFVLSAACSVADVITSDAPTGTTRIPRDHALNPDKLASEMSHRIMSSSIPHIANRAAQFSKPDTAKYVSDLSKTADKALEAALRGEDPIAEGDKLSTSVHLNISRAKTAAAAALSIYGAHKPEDLGDISVVLNAARKLGAPGAVKLIGAGKIDKLFSGKVGDVLGISDKINAIRDLKTKLGEFGADVFEKEALSLIKLSNIDGFHLAGPGDAGRPWNRARQALKKDAQRAGQLLKAFK